MSWRHWTSRSIRRIASYGIVFAYRWLADLRRPVYRCRLCGRSVFADHGLGLHNLRSHEDACPRQQSVRYRRLIERSCRKRHGSDVGSTVPPAVGQLGFPFDGVESEVLA